MALLYRVSSPQLLMPESGARWLVSANPLTFAADVARLRLSGFRTVVKVSAPPSGAMAHLRSLGHAELFVNGRLAAQSSAWHGRQEFASVDLAPFLHAGDNDIVVEARYAWGPSALLFFCDSLDLRSGDAWQASVDGRRWNPAKLATGTETRPQHMMQWNGPAELAAHSGVLMLLAALGAAAAFVLRHGPWRAGEAGAPLLAWQWTLMTALAALHAWNFTRMPPMLGMDMEQHVQYVNYILQHWALPFADQGWQMFQPPLAYLAAAVVEMLRARIAPGVAPMNALLMLTLACSLATALIACRICALAFNRAGTAAVAMLVAAFLPASLYLAHTFGNEPFAALFGTLLVYESVRLLKGSRVPLWAIVRIGLWLGLGLLSKPTVVLLLPAVCAVVAWRGRSVATWTASVRPVGAILAIGLSIASWWYVRNMVHFGRPFVGGWEPGRGYDWWQYPGYRVPEHWLRFGESLVRPFYSGLDSFWDGIYSTLWLDGVFSGRILPGFEPPWNLPVMSTLGLLSLPVLAAILWGGWRAACYPKSELERSLGLFAGANVGLFLMAMALVFGQVPAYSAGKGSYLLAALGCLPILVGLGVDRLMGDRVGSVAVGALSAMWLGSVMLAFLAR